MYHAAQRSRHCDGRVRHGSSTWCAHGAGRVRRSSTYRCRCFACRLMLLPCMLCNRARCNRSMWHGKLTTRQQKHVRHTGSRVDGRTSQPVVACKRHGLCMRRSDLAPRPQKVRLELGTKFCTTESLALRFGCRARSPLLRQGTAHHIQASPMPLRLPLCPPLRPPLCK